MPYRIWLHNQVQLVGTPDYGLDDCPAGYYRSAIIVRANDTHTDISSYQDAVFAYNQTFSQSGYAAPFWHLKPHGFWFTNRLHVEQHLESARAVTTGLADIASIDAVTWRNIEKYEPFATELHVLEWTNPTPGLPLITARDNDADLIFSAISAAIDELDELSRTQLGIRGIVSISKEDYLKVRNPE